ncbi:MAG: RHS repeat-associated core domain-containing protein, partial [Acidimicrobiia bacterium]
SYTYNGYGLRVSKTVVGTTTPFVWDLSGGLPLLLKEGSTSYVYGPGGLPLERIDTAGTVVYFHQDQLGSTRLLTDAAGAVAASYSYDPYGKPAGSNGMAVNPLGYAGQYSDVETGLQYLRARYYQPATGQFLTRDPLIPLTRSPYGYVSHSPLNSADPSGLIDCLLYCHAPCGTGVCPAQQERNVSSLCLGWAQPKLLPSIVDLFLGISPLTLFKEGGGDSDRPGGESGGEKEAVRNPAQDKKLTSGDIDKLKAAGIDPEELKGGVKNWAMGSVQRPRW